MELRQASRPPKRLTEENTETHNSHRFLERSRFPQFSNIMYLEKGPLSRFQAFSLLLKEFDGHILEYQPSLEANHSSSSGQGASHFDRK